MPATYYECIPIISQLNYQDKLRLTQWLINNLVTENNIDNTTTNATTNQTGLCGIWQDARSAEIIAQEIIHSRTHGRVIDL